MSKLLLGRNLRLLRVALSLIKVKLDNLLVKIKRLNELSSEDLNHRVSVSIGFGQKESGILTDVYGAMDSDTHAVIALELDNNLTFYLPPHTEVELS